MLDMTPLGWLGRKTSTQTNNPSALASALVFICSLLAGDFQPQHVWKLPGSSRSCYQFSLPATSQDVAACTALVCGAQCSMPVRLGYWQSQTSTVGEWQGNDQTDLQCQAIVTTRSSELLAWLGIEDLDRILMERRLGMDMSNAPMMQSRQPLTFRLMESVGLGGLRWHESSWQREITESGSSWLSTLIMDIPGDLVWDLPCVQQASYLEGGPPMWMLPLYPHVNQKCDVNGYCSDMFQPLISDQGRYCLSLIQQF